MVLLVKEWKLLTVDGQVILLQFESNGTGIYSTTNEGELVSFPFKWTWGTNEETLNMNLSSYKVVWIIDKLTSDALWFFDEDDMC